MMDMDGIATPVTELTDAESWDYLKSVSLGRLVTTVGGWT